MQYLNSKDVPSYLRGGYTGNKFSFDTSLTGNIPTNAGQWDGGSRDVYSLLELATGRAVPIDGQHEEFPMRPGFAIVCHSMFCGKDFGLRFTLHPNDATKMLANVKPLSEFEQLVLNATRSYKSHYNGQDRYEMARTRGKFTKEEIAMKIAKNRDILAKHGNVKRRDGQTISERIAQLEAITDFYPTRAEWETAKQSLIALKYLNRAGAITPDGRNASQSLS